MACCTCELESCIELLMHNTSSKWPLKKRWNVHLRLLNTTGKKTGMEFKIRKQNPTSLRHIIPIKLAILPFPNACIIPVND